MNNQANQANKTIAIVRWDYSLTRYDQKPLKDDAGNILLFETQDDAAGWAEENGLVDCWRAMRWGKEAYQAVVAGDLDTADTQDSATPIFGHDDDAWDQSVFHPLTDVIGMMSQLAKELEDGRRGTFLKESWNSGQSEFYANDVLDAIGHMIHDLECAKAQVETYLEFAECQGQRVKA